MMRRAGVDFELYHPLDVDPAVQEVHGDRGVFLKAQNGAEAQKEEPADGDDEHAGAKYVRDVMTFPLEELQNVDGIICGPECPPWSNSGRKAGAGRDARSSGYETILQRTEELAGRENSALLFVAEDSQLSSATLGCEAPWAGKVLARLRKNVPTCIFDIETLSLQQFLAHRRDPPWLLGMCEDVLVAAVLARIPRPIRAFSRGRIALRDVL